jgi:hypothetical protein
VTATYDEQHVNTTHTTDNTIEYDEALTYIAAGLHVTPLKLGDRNPKLWKMPVHVGWPDLASTDPDTARNWWQFDYRGHGVGIVPKQLPNGLYLVIIDVDEHHADASGHKSLERLENIYGELPVTPTVLTPGNGKHLYFTSPVPISSKTGKKSNSEPGPLGLGIDVRGLGGFAVAPPSRHGNGGRYQWHPEHSLLTTPLAPLPEAIVDRLTASNTAPKRQSAPARLHETGDDSPATRFIAGTTWAELLERDGWSFSHTDSTGEEHWTRPGKDKREGTSATVNNAGLDLLHVFTTSVRWLESDTSYNRFQYEALSKHGGDMSQLARQIMADSRFYPDDLDWIPEDTLDDTTELTSDTVDNLDTIVELDTVDEQPSAERIVDTAITKTSEPSKRLTLPEEFWTARPVLEHIRQAARSRLVAPVAVLAHVLARVAANTPPSYCVPGYIGGNTPLSLYFALVARSGAGKSAPVRVLNDLMPMLPGALPLGSGEGLVEAFLDFVDVVEDDKKTRRKKQTRHGLVFHLDEGSALADIASRSGATILPKLCQAWTGDALGEANAGEETRRYVPPVSYHLGVTFLFQPSKVRPLMEDVGRGLPQRFLFLEPFDPGMTRNRPAWPGSLDWKPLPLITEDGTASGKVTHHPLTYPDYVDQQTVELNFLQESGQLTLPELDAHRNLQRIKLAGVLALLDGNRKTVDDLDWHLAGLLLGYSDAVRQTVLDTLKVEDRVKETAATHRAVSRSVALIEGEERRALNSAIRTIVGKLNRAGQPLNRRELSRAIAGKHRNLVGVDVIFDEALKRGEIIENGDNYTLPKGKK